MSEKRVPIEIPKDLVINDHDLKKMETWCHLDALRKNDSLLLIKTIRFLKIILLEQVGQGIDPETISLLLTTKAVYWKY